MTRYSINKNSSECSGLWITNMALTQEAVENLKAIHEKETGEKLSDGEAWEMATRLLELGRLLAGKDNGSYPQPTFDADAITINNELERCEKGSMSQAL